MFALLLGNTDLEKSFSCVIPFFSKDKLKKYSFLYLFFLLFPFSYTSQFPFPRKHLLYNNLQ